MKLECSSKGDKRFSAFYAFVEFDGKYDSIEHHYQNCKRNSKHQHCQKGEYVSYRAPRRHAWRRGTAGAVLRPPASLLPLSYGEHIFRIKIKATAN